MYAVGDNRNASRIDQPERQNVFSRRRARTDDLRRFPETAQRVFRHGSKRQRPSFMAGLEDAAESVQIMARHNRSLRRQLMDQLRIARVHDVKYIELVTAAPQPARIIPKPVEQTVTVEHEPGCVADASEPSLHRRTQ